MKTTLITLTICLILSVVTTFAQDSQNSQPKTQSTPSTSVNNDKLIQLLLSDNENLKKENKRLTDDATVKDGQMIELRSSRDKWQHDYFEEVSSRQKLEGAYFKLQDSYTDQGKALKAAQDQTKLDKDFIASQDNTIRRLKTQRIVWAGISFLIGGRAGYAYAHKGN